VETITLRHAIRSVASRHPDRPAIIVEEQRWTYAELDAAIDRLAGGLVAFGIKPGDRVALHFTNGIDVVVGYHACFRAGVIAVPLNTRMKGPELQYVLNHSGARLYLGQPALFAEIDPVRSGVQSVEGYFLNGEVTAASGVRQLADLSASSGAPAALPDVDEDAVATILYTSGTTSRPKGVTHTVRTLSHMADHLVQFAEMETTEVVGIVVPVCHVFGLSMLLAAFAAGSTAVMIPRFEPLFVLEQVRRHAVNIFGGLPVMLNALVHAPGAGAFHFPSLRVCVAGGDAVPTDLQRRFKDTFDVDVTEGCGMTEAHPFSCNPIGGRGKPGSIGLPAPGATLRLVDPFGRDVPRGDEGEILVRTTAMMIGYWNDPEATAATISDGWLRTGDLARVDEDGYYWFVGRKKEIIIRGGSNISPLEVEEALYQHPAVREVGVVGAPDAALGEVVTAFIALKAAATEEEIKQFLAPRMAAYKIPERIYFVPDLPKGLTGKVQRKALKELAARSV
jgi:long-chain acyl-CoA synthetase